MHEHAILEPHPDGGRQHDVDLERADQQRPHGPLVPVEEVLRVGPRREGGPEQALDVLVEGQRVGRIEADPEAVTPVRRLVSPQARHDEADEGRDQGRQDEPRRAAKGAAGHRLESGRRIPLLVGELERLVGAHKARQEGEDGHADAALPRYPQVRQLQQPRGGIGGVGGPE